MKEIEGDLFTQNADAICITTNGSVKMNGECVMGRGCAQQAKQHWPHLPSVLGDMIKLTGNRVYLLHCLRTTNTAGVSQRAEPLVVSFPVKHNWWERADTLFIQKSASELAEFIEVFNWQRVVLPRPGCGKLEWSKVQPIVEEVFNRWEVLGRINIIKYPLRER